MVYRQVLLTFTASKSLKLFKTFLYSFFLLLDFNLTRFAFDVLPERVWVETATFAPEKRNLNYHRFRYLMLAGCDWWISFRSVVNTQDWRKFWKRFRGCLVFQSRISTKTVVRFALCKRWPKQVITTDTVRESSGFAVMTSFKNTRELLAGAY